MPELREVICERCGTVAAAGSSTPGSLALEVSLWVFLVVPGMFYSVWRHTSRKPACAECGSPDIVSIDTPRGRRLLEASSRY